MSGAWIPYHLRQNKAVDRMLLIDLLSKLNRYIEIHSYEYIGFGGPFLEDHKLMHSYFGNIKLTSIENNDHIWKRQKFNLPLSCINREKKHSSEFIDTFSRNNPVIIWLDYMEANKRREQLMEFESLLPKLNENDIVKVTINANPQTLWPDSARKSDNTHYSTEEKQQKRYEALDKQIGDYLPQGITLKEMDKKLLPR